MALIDKEDYHIFKIPGSSESCESHNMNNETGLLDTEQAIMDSLVSAINKFAKLPLQHPEDLIEFALGIHTCQKLLALRVIRRDYPKGWYNKQKD